MEIDIEEKEIFLEVLQEEIDTHRYYIKDAQEASDKDTVGYFSYRWSVLNDIHTFINETDV